MHKLVSKLIVYRNLPADNILMPLAEVCAEVERGSYNKEQTIGKVYDQIHKLLDIATVYGFNKNLWHNYLTYLLVSVETPFAITCEKEGACEGSVNALAMNDFAIFKALFEYDFTALERSWASTASILSPIIRQWRKRKHALTKISAKRCRA